MAIFLENLLKMSRLFCPVDLLFTGIVVFFPEPGCLQQVCKIAGAAMVWPENRTEKKEKNI